MPHPVVYSGNLDALMAEWIITRKDKLGDGECARLPQILTSVGHTSGWQRGPRVMDSPGLPRGTVIANFKLIDGKWKYPNASGYHAALFNKFEGGRVMDGFPAAFSIVDQWTGKEPGERGIPIVTPRMARSEHAFRVQSNNADEFYVVLVR